MHNVSETRMTANCFAYNAKFATVTTTCHVKAHATICSLKACAPNSGLATPPLRRKPQAGSPYFGVPFFMTACAASHNTATTHVGDTCA